jgi:cation transporter-like permease
MVYEDIAQNKRSTFFLMFLMILVISGLGYIIGRLYGGDPYLFMAIAAVIAFLMSFFS